MGCKNLHHIFAALIFTKTMNFKSAIIIGVLLAVSQQSFALTDNSENSTIVSNIVSNSNSTITHPKELESRLILNKSVSETTDSAKTTNHKIAGFRIQVFSDNNSRTAKNEARTKASIIAAQFSQYQTYVIYNSPFWRLRVGDFISEDEANDAAAELKSAFPSFRKEIRVVRDKIIVTE